MKLLNAAAADIRVKTVAVTLVLAALVPMMSGEGLRRSKPPPVLIL